MMPKYPRTIQTPQGEQTIVGELCTCGHTQEAHDGLTGHGPCTIQRCPCKQYTWQDFIFEEE